MPWATSTRRHRLPSNWQTLRRQVKARAKGQCEWTEQGDRCTNPGTDCDHITPGDDHSLNNLQWLCRFHHKIKTSRETRRATNRKPTEPHPGLI